MPFETSDLIIETQDVSTMNTSWPKLLRRPLSNSCSQVCYHCYRVTSHTARRQEKCVFPRQPSTLQASIQIRRYAAFQSSVPHQPSNEPIHQVRAESWNTYMEGKISNRVFPSLILHNCYYETEFGPCPNQLSIHCLAFHTLFADPLRNSCIVLLETGYTHSFRLTLFPFDFYTSVIHSSVFLIPPSSIQAFSPKQLL